jgi:hypothetical protein
MSHLTHYVFLRHRVPINVMSQDSTNPLIPDPIPVCDRALEVFHSPKLTVGCGRVRTEQGTRRVLLQSHFQVLALGGSQFGMIASHAVIHQALQAHAAIVTVPFHQAGAATTGDFLNLLNGVTHPIQPHRLSSSPGRAVARLGIGSDQFLDLSLA